MAELSSRNSRVMLVDDHPLVRRGLAGLINETIGLEVCGQAGSAEDALAMIDDCSPDLMVIDISLPGINGVDLIKRVRTRDSDVRILVSSMYDEKIFAERCIRAGANGYVDKESAASEVLNAINAVLEGRLYVSSEMTSRMLQVAMNVEQGTKSSLETLTDRELEVFSLIGHGLPTRKIAERLHLSVKTIETHRDHVRQKMGVGSSVELMRHAVQWVLENT